MTEGEKTTARSIAFVLKGPYALAHCEFLSSFLEGCDCFREKVKVVLILLDEPKKPKVAESIAVHSFANINNTYDKLQAYSAHMAHHQYDHICWIACIQNICLYMGMQMAASQGYWSMKYHSIIMPTLQKYAGLGFGGEPFSYDTQNWYRGRAFPKITIRKISTAERDSLRRKIGLDEAAKLAGCFVRAEKLHSIQFWNSVDMILDADINSHFVVASQSLPPQAIEWINQSSNSKRFHYLGWIDTKLWSQVLDIYYDSTPRGSCNTIFEAIYSLVPVLMVDSTHNRESSALPYLQSAVGPNKTIPGVYDNISDGVNYAIKLLKDSNARSSLAHQQRELLNSLSGHQALFAKDYLNYFLDLRLTIS